MNSAEEELVKSLREANKAIVKEARRTASPKEFKPNPANYTKIQNQKIGGQHATR